MTTGSTPVVLVGIDESPESAAAARFAHRLGLATGASIVALESATPTSAEYSPDDRADDERLIRERLAGWLPVDVAADADIRVSDAGPETALVDLARTLDAAHVVIGSRPTEGVTSLGLGSLAHRLAHDLTCPLIVVPAQADTATGNVVVGIDGSDASRVALDAAAAVAHALGGTAYAVYAVDDVYTSFRSHGYYGHEEGDVREEVDDTGPRVEFVERLGGSPEDVLTDVVREHDATLLVVAARERGSFGGVLLGEVPDHLLHEPPCPVMVLPHEYVTAVEAARAEQSA